MVYGVLKFQIIQHKFFLFIQCSLRKRAQLLINKELVLHLNKFFEFYYNLKLSGFSLKECKYVFIILIMTNKSLSPMRNFCIHSFSFPLNDFMQTDNSLKKKFYQKDDM